MSVHVNIDYNITPNTITLPIVNQQQIDVILPSMHDEQNIVVSEFPMFIKTILESNLAFIRADIGINMIAQRLIVDADPLVITDIDTLSLSELDMGQNITYYSV